MDAAFEAVLDERSTRGPIAAGVGNVVLHPCLWIHLQLDGTYWSSQSRVDLTGIFIIVVIFGTARLLDMALVIF